MAIHGVHCCSCGFQDCNGFPSFGCPLEEYQALMEIRSSLLRDHGTSLPTWGRGRDCCSWERVRCNNSSGRVSELILSNLSEYGPVPNGTHIDQLHEWQLNFNILSSFHELQQLRLSGSRIVGSLEHMGNTHLASSSTSSSNI